MTACAQQLPHSSPWSLMGVVQSPLLSLQSKDSGRSDGTDIGGVSRATDLFTGLFFRLLSFIFCSEVICEREVIPGVHVGVIFGRGDVSSGLVFVSAKPENESMVKTPRIMRAIDNRRGSRDWGGMVKSVMGKGIFLRFVETDRCSGYSEKITPSPKHRWFLLPVPESSH